MSEGIVVAIIGAVATVIAAWIGRRVFAEPPSPPRPGLGDKKLKGGAEREQKAKGSAIKEVPLPAQSSTFSFRGTVRAVIRSDGAYADGMDHQYVAADKPLPVGFPSKDGERIGVVLEVGGKVFKAGVRSTSSVPYAWISPDLVGSDGTPARLTAVLEGAGFRRNQSVVIDVDGTELRITTP